jgi:CRISP-associated protein Cas1
MMQIVVNTFGAALRRNGGRFIIRAGERELAVSAQKVESILVTTGVLLSSDALKLAVDHNIDVVFLDPNGEPFGRFWQNRMGSTAAIRRRQLEVAEAAEGLEIVRGWCEAKLRNQVDFLEELGQRRPADQAIFESTTRTIRDSRERITKLGGSVDEQRATLMGLEGVAGRVYFACLGRLVPDVHRFEGRSRNPAQDGFNAMLNYAYGVLYSLVDRACICAGLDPFVGLLHTDNYGKKSLIFDMIEPFRVLGDRTVVLLFTGRRVKAEFFETIPGGVALSPAGRAALLESFNERLDKSVRYASPSGRGRTRNVKRRDVIRWEAHALANRLLGKADLPRIVETRQLWAEGNEAAIDEDDDELSPALPDDACGDVLPEKEPPSC